MLRAMGCDENGIFLLENFDVYYLLVQIYYWNEEL